MHRQVISLVEQGKTAEEILAAFVAQHDESVLMAPPRRGFNLTAYFLPGAAILIVGAVLARMLVRRSRVEPATADAAEGDLAPADAERLASEMERLEL